jgi:hypothetical protein
MLSLRHGVSLEVNLLRVVDQTVQDGVGQSEQTDRLMPMIDGELTADNRGPCAVAVMEDFIRRSRR